MTSSTMECIDKKEEQGLSRSSKNARLYKEVYGKYDTMDNLPIEDNTDEIDIEKLREIVYGNDDTTLYKNLKEDLEVLDTRKRNIDKQRMYDINKILEKAKNENNKLKDLSNTSSKHNNDILSTLEIKTLSYEYEIKDNIDDDSKKSRDDEEKKIEKVIDDEVSLLDNENMYMTREFKFRELNDKISELNASSNPLIDNVMEDSDLSLELFEDLKPTGDTIVTKPIVDNDKFDFDNKANNYEGDMYSSDTRDIDVLKSVVEKEEPEFFTNSSEFYNKDFNAEEMEDFFDEKKSHNIFKIILLLVAILIFSFVIVYFVLNYGIGV